MATQPSDMSCHTVWLLKLVSEPKSKVNSRMLICSGSEILLDFSVRPRNLCFPSH